MFVVGADGLRTHLARLLSGWRTPWSVRAPSALQPPRASEYPAPRRNSRLKPLNRRACPDGSSSPRASSSVSPAPRAPRAGTNSHSASGATVARSEGSPRSYSGGRGQGNCVARRAAAAFTDFSQAKRARTTAAEARSGAQLWSYVPVPRLGCETFIASALRS